MPHLQQASIIGDMPTVRAALRLERRNRDIDAPEQLIDLLQVGEFLICPFLVEEKGDNLGAHIRGAAWLRQMIRAWTKASNIRRSMEEAAWPSSRSWSATMPASTGAANSASAGPAVEALTFSTSAQAAPISSSSPALVSDLTGSASCAVGHSPAPVSASIFRTRLIR
jgi:hypothetical protein